MKKILILTAISSALIGYALVAVVGASNDKPKEDHKVTICHKQKNTLSVDFHAVKAHLKHGDTLGACVEQEPEKCPAGSYEIDRTEDGKPICKAEPTGCPYGDSIPLGAECDKHKPVQPTTPAVEAEVQSTEPIVGK